MTREELLNDLILKLNKYKNVEEVKKYLNDTEDEYNKLNNQYSINVFPTKYINEQKIILENMSRPISNDCEYCELASDKRKELLKNADSVFDVASDYDSFIDRCKKSCPTYAKNFSYYLNDEGIECIDAMIDIFGIEKVKDFCLLNAYKFFWRCEKKDGKWDVNKALGYLELYRKLEDK